MIGIEILIGLIIIAGLVALETKTLKTSVMSLAGAGFFFVIASFLFSSIEVAIGGIVTFAVVIPLFLWALRRTTPEDTTKRIETKNDIFVLISVIAFIVVLLLVFLPLLDLPELVSPPPEPIEGPIGLSILREVLVLLAAAAGIWAIIRKIGRRQK